MNTETITRPSISPAEPNISAAELEAQHERSKNFRVFPRQIEKMNEMYRLPAHGLPVLPKDPVKQLANFKDILAEEVNEIDDIIEMLNNFPDLRNSPEETDEQWQKRKNLAVMTAIADLLGDVIVFCRSEALKFGIPLEDILNIIMESNFSKLGADGKPIYDERNKVQKGPAYYKPEPKISALLNGGPGVLQGEW